MQVGVPVGRKFLPGEFDHRRSAINAQNATHGHSVGELGCHFAIAASQINDRLASVQSQPGDQLQSPFELARRMLLIVSGIPLVW